MLIRAFLLLALLAAASLPFGGARRSPPAADLARPDCYTLVGPRHLVSGHPARATSEVLNAVVEMPAGTLDKWSVQADGTLRRRIENGLPKRYAALPLPANLGSVPSTWSVGVGAEDEPLDVLVLGSALERGSVVQARVVGVLRIVEDGVRDDKLLCVPGQGPFASVTGLAELRARFPGALDLLGRWFESAGDGACLGAGDASEAEDLIEAGRRAWRHRVERAGPRVLARTALAESGR